MCDCLKALESAAAEKELRHVPADRARLVLGNGNRILFDVVCVTENQQKEIALCCSQCSKKWLVKINNKYSIEQL